MTGWIAMLLTALMGALLAVQVGLNSMMRVAAGHAAWAALINFTIGTIGLALFALTIRAPVPSIAQLGSVPAWAWIAGLFGAGYVAISTITGPVLGAATFLALTVAGQMAASLVIDSYGLVAVMLSIGMGWAAGRFYSWI